MFTKAFWLGDNGALTRCIRTAAQTAIATITVSTFTPFSVGEWINVLVLSSVSGLVSLLMSIDRREALVTPPPEFEVAVDRKFTFAPLTPQAAPQAVLGCGDDLR